MIDRTEQEIMQNWKGDMDTPLVSICTITYNHEQFIAEAIDSFLIQETDFPFEIVVDDDFSPDGTAHVIKQYMEKYPKIMNICLREKNVGMITNFTENMKRAKGKYIALCEGDDYWTDPLKLQKQVDFLEKNTDYVISGHDAFIVDENGKHYKDSKLPDIYKKDFNSEYLILNETWVLTLSMVFRNVISNEIPNEINMVLNGDNFLTTLLGHHGKSKYHIDIKPAAYRVHSGGVWSLLSEQEKLDAQSNTYFWIYRYYNRIGAKKYAKAYLSKYYRLILPGMESDLIFNELKNRSFAYIPEPIKKILRPFKYLVKS